MIAKRLTFVYLNRSGGRGLKFPCEAVKLSFARRAVSLSRLAELNKISRRSEQ